MLLTNEVQITFQLLIFEIGYRHYHRTFGQANQQVHLLI